MQRSCRFLFVFFILIPLSSVLRADNAAIQLAPIVKEGTPGDLLMQDAVVPSWQGAASTGASSGTLQKSLSDQIALPVISTAVPGNNVQLRGLGRSAEDTDVQTLGIPLNPGQGGGFDLSIFPQFIWSSYEFQAGPALGTFDPRGTAGSLTLTPWSSQALMGGASSGRAIALGSTANVFQVSAAATDGKNVAAVLGTSAGDAQGPSGALSARYRLSESQVLSFHLLVTDIDAKSPGPSGLTPFAHQQTIRGIPLLQLDSKLGTQGLLKMSVFADSEYLRYDDPSLSGLPATQDHIEQVGTENALLWGDWKFGAGLRGVRYRTLGFADQSEAVLDLLISRTIEPVAGLLVEPTVRVVGVSSYGAVPEASLGARVALSEPLAVFARGGLSRHFPSMLNRFYSYPGFTGFPGFVGNPALQPEEDWTGTCGVEWKSRAFQATLQGYGQYAQDSQVRAPLDATNDTVVNLGNARIESLMAHAQWAAVSWLDLAVAGTFTDSRLSFNGLAFPGQPQWLGVFSAGVHAPGELVDGGYRWEAKVYERISSDSVADATGSRLPWYHEEDVELRAHEGAWGTIARMEDVTNQQPQLVKGYPSFGRAVSLLVSREF